MEKNKKEVVFNSLIYGKEPPYSKDAEEKVLGIMLYEPKSVSEVKEILKAEDFYLDEHKTICSAILKVSETTTPDTVMVSEELLKKGELESIGGGFRLIKLMNSVVSSANLKRYCLLIKEKSVKRRLIDFSGVILSKTYDNANDLFDLLSEAENKLKGINYELDEMKITPISSIAMNVIERFDTRVYNAKNNIVDENEVYTGIKDWDRINGPLFPGLYVIAGRPGMGKGVHMTECVCRMAKKYEIGIINGEMTEEQFLTRIGCNLLDINNFLFKKNAKHITEGEQDLVHEAMNAALDLKIHIEGSRYINKIANRIKLWVEKSNVKCVFADFLTLFKVPPDVEKYYTETQKVNYVLEVFTQLCKDLKIPIILYVQMNREILGRGGTKEPNLSDLKQSGSIEELAFQVSFIHRPEYYDAEAITDDFGESTKGLAYQIIAKHRDGELGRIKLRANLACSQMKEWEDQSGFSFKQEDIVGTPF
ncbi:MAG TPA: DnaB-like helicase C-terminal domain-containing protein [Hanamia sp.]